MEPIAEMENTVVVDKEEFDSLRASHDALLAAFKKYGGHAACCTIRAYKVCDCGFEQAIKEAKELK